MYNKKVFKFIIGSEHMEITNVPKHIGIILDGNRRFARKLMMKPWKGHEWGREKVEKVLSWAKEYDVKELTLYAFSIQNFNRPKEEFDYLMKLSCDAFNKIKDDERISDIRINFIGRINLFPENVQKSMNKLMEETKNNGPYVVNFAMAYGGQEEVIDAVKKISEQVKQGKLDIDKINEDSFKDYLYLKDSPDLIIRTGGEKRTSNFLNYQAAYSELVFLEKTWPEFEKEDFVECMKEYSNRQRRFGR